MSGWSQQMRGGKVIRPWQESFTVGLGLKAGKDINDPVHTLAPTYSPVKYPNTMPGGLETLCR